MLLQQPLRVGGLALASALATAILAMVTFLVSNLILAVVAGIGVTGGVVPEPAGTTGSPDGVQGLLLSGQTEDEDAADDRCRRRAELILQHSGKPSGVHRRCAGQRGSAGAARP